MTLSIARLYPADDRVVLALHGTLDERAAAPLRAALTVETRRTPRPLWIVVDLGGVDHVDPAGVGSLVAGNQLCASAGIQLAVRGPSPLVRGLLRLSTVDPSASPPAADDQLTRRCIARHLGLSMRRRRSGAGGVGPSGRGAAAARPRRGR